MTIEIKIMGLINYQDAYNKMLFYHKIPKKICKNQIWCLQHPAVFTQGRHGKLKRKYNFHNIPIVLTDRGGQITYHGPGQAIIYFMLNLKQYNFGIKKLVHCIEQSCVNQLKQYGIISYTLSNAPGVYTNNKKIASLGLRVKDGKIYHGLAINTKMDLTPFYYIDPCGHEGLKMTQISEFFPEITIDQVFLNYTEHFISNFSK